MVDREETPQQRMDKMAERALDLKKRREDERQAIVQEKLYQQWRSSIDDMRSMDQKIVQLKTIADRDFQLDEKDAQRAEGGLITSSTTTCGKKATRRSSSGRSGRRK